MGSGTWVYVAKRSQPYRAIRADGTLDFERTVEALRQAQTAVAAVVVGQVG
ncbi:MAG: hypothetical protein HYV07_08025 [Deltaproteobacteria bacterium]|nr:hypothetical protein [Deltaproteobacteria bacterium]